MHYAWTGEKWRSASEEERAEHQRNLMSQLVLYIDMLVDQGELEGLFQIDETVFRDVVQCYYADIQRLSERKGPSNPDEYKQKSFYIFWIRKLKPILIKQGNGTRIRPDGGHWINEYVGFVMALAELDINLSKDVLVTLSTEFLYDFLYYFRYKSVSPHALYSAFRGMYELAPLAELE